MDRRAFLRRAGVVAGTVGATALVGSLAACSSNPGHSQAGGTTTTGTTGATPVGTTAGVTAVPTTLTVQGDYAQMTAFVNGLDSFPRLFVIQKFILAFGKASTSSSSSTSATDSSSSSSSAGAANTTPLWTGGTATSPTSGPYNLNITGSIYYTSTPNALAACSQARAAQSTLK